MTFVSLTQLMENFDLLCFNHSFCAGPFHLFIFIPPIKVLAPEDPLMHRQWLIAFPYFQKLYQIAKFARCEKSIRCTAEQCVQHLVTDFKNRFFLQLQSKCKITICHPAMTVAECQSQPFLNWQISTAILFMSFWAFNSIITLFFSLRGGHNCFFSWQSSEFFYWKL